MGTDTYWLGSLSVGMRDASGQMYMRNRYYNPGTGAWHDDAAKPQTVGTDTYWLGSLSVGMRDASGQMYMRNRYYNPATGQFTQPDPIGLAGGLNSYGFAAGDPVTYGDPYGRSAQRDCEPFCTAADLALLAADVADVRQNGLNLANGTGIVLGTVCTALPLITGCGAADEVIEGGVRLLRGADNAVDAGRAVQAGTAGGRKGRKTVHARRPIRGHRHESKSQRRDHSVLGLRG